LTAIATDGDPIPGTSETIDSFLSPPHVVGTTVYFGAFTTNFDSYLLRSKNGVLETLIKPGDTIDGHAITQIAASGFDVSGDTVYFNALKNANSVILSQTGDDAPIVAIDNTILPGTHQFSVRDVEGDRIIFGDNNYLYATLDSPAVPIITRDMLDLGGTFDQGASMSLSVDALGDAPLAYEWHLNGILIENATGPSIEIPDFQAGNAGYYSLKITNTYGSAFSQGATLVLNSKPIFQNSENPIIVNSGFPLLINLQIAGLTPMTYEWYKNGELLDGTNSKNFYLPEATPTDAGTYTQKATNNLGDATSADVVVTINPAPENPVWAEHQFETQFTLPATIDGIEISAFASTATYPGGFIGNTYNASTVYNGILFIPNSGEPTALVTLASLNSLTGKTYANIYFSAADSAGNITFYANNAANNNPAVFVREFDGTITTLASKGDVIPGRPDKTFASVYAIAIDGVNRVYGGSFTGGNGIIVKVDAQGTTVVLDEFTNLPALGYSVKFPTVNLLEGGSFYFSQRKPPPDFQNSALFHYASNGDISLVIKTGDPIGSEGSTLASSFNGLKRFKNKLYLADSDAGIVEVGNRSATLALGPNSPVSGGGVMGSVSGFVAVTDTTVYFDQSYKPVEGAQRQGIFSWDGTELKLVFSPTHIDDRRVLSSRFWAVGDTGTIFAGITFPDKTLGILSNTGDNPDAEPIFLPDPLRYEIISETVIRIFIPIGLILESSPNLGKPWTEIPGATQIDITLTEIPIFFRLRALE